MAVYTRVTDEEVAAFAASYGLGRVCSLHGIAEGVENTNYRLDAERGSFILTLYEKRVAPLDLPFFLDLMEHLAAAGIGCPTPLRDRDGRNLGTLAGRPAAVTTFLPGAWPRTQTAAQCHAVGRALAELHRAGQSFPGHRDNALGLAGWRPLYERFAAHADEIAPGLSSSIETELACLETAWPKSLPAGVIHADLFPDNVFFSGEKISGLIDFYFACNDALAYDVAVCLNAWCFTRDVAIDLEKSAALLAGYQCVRRLEPAERAALPLLARGAALRFLLTRAYDWLNTPATALVAPHDPKPYLQRLEVHRGVVDAAAYGLEPAAP